jgi:glycerol-3-phosphate dehydrogenase
VTDTTPNCETIETLVIGGGITGACFFHVAARRGRDVVLVEQGDFGSGTSQASGMMIWGGLLYLRNFEFALVRKLSRARDHLLRRHAHQVQLRRFEFLPLAHGGRSSLLVWAGLQLYRALSGFRRGRVMQAARSAHEHGFRRGRFARAWSYEEGFLRTSDTRFALDWLLDSGRFEKAHNHTSIEALAWNPSEKVFEAILRDTISGSSRRLKARQVVNCAGPWTDSVNARYGISSTVHHHPSKGVYLVLPGTGDDQALAMEMEHEGDTLCWVPWGPVVLWGPTETDIEHPDQAKATKEDVDFLLDRLNRNSARNWTRDDILNVRVGTRPLALPPGAKPAYSLDLSRRAILEKHPTLPWSSAFGGKLSGALDFALDMHAALHGESLSPRDLTVASPRSRPTSRAYFHALEITDPAWSRDHESCRTLEDFLRRRTNVAQWIARGGLGREGEHLEDLRHIAALLHPDDPQAAQRDLEVYLNAQREIDRSWNHG